MEIRGKQMARRDYEEFIYNITFDSVECVYDIGVVWAFEDGRVFVV